MTSMIVSKVTVCPVCGVENPSAAAALRCWLRHNPDLPARNTLAEIGEQLGVTRERVRQVLKRAGENRRAGTRYRQAAGPPRPTPAQPADLRMLPPIAAVRGQPAPWLRTAVADGPEAEKRRERDRVREMTDHRRDYKRRRHNERMASDPAYRQARREKGQRKYARRRARKAESEEQE
jgi:hypothetical protein